MTKVGRPTKYKKIYADEMLEFFSIEPFEEVEVKYVGKDGNPWSKFEDRPNRLPTFERFAFKIGVDTDTLKNWANEVYAQTEAESLRGQRKHPEFFGAYIRCKELQKNFLIENGILGLYSAPFTIFVSKNITDMRDRVETDITSGGEKLPSPILGVNPNVHTDNSDKEDTGPKAEN